MKRVGGICIHDKFSVSPPINKHSEIVFFSISEFLHKQRITVNDILDTSDIKTNKLGHMKRQLMHKNSKMPNFLPD